MLRIIPSLTLFYNKYRDGINSDQNSREIVLGKILHYCEYNKANEIRRCDLVRFSGIPLPRVNKAIKWLERNEFIKVNRKRKPKQSWIAILDSKASKQEINNTRKRNAAQNSPVDRVAGPRDKVLVDPDFEWEDVDLNDVHFVFRD